MNDERILKELTSHILSKVPLAKMNPDQLERWLTHCMVKCVQESGKSGNVVYRTIWLSKTQAIQWEFTIMTLREKFDHPGEAPRERFLVCAGSDLNAAKARAVKVTTMYMYQWDVEGAFYWFSFNYELDAIKYIQLQEKEKNNG